MKPDLTERGVVGMKGSYRVAAVKAVLDLVIRIEKREAEEGRNPHLWKRDEGFGAWFEECVRLVDAMHRERWPGR